LWGRGLGQTEEDVEGQVYLMKPHREGNPDETEGHTWGHSFEPVGADDTEGHMPWSRLEPSGADDTEGRLWGHLKPEEDGTWTLELDDDTEGHYSYEG
jgi:hypothetical protein